MISEKDKEFAEQLIIDFRARWLELGDAPFHSREIRRKEDGFAWLRKDTKRAALFLNNLTELLLELPVTGLACVIDRPGYNLRYKEQYANDRWPLCKTAFAVVIERAVKHAAAQGQNVKIYVERCTKVVDKTLKEYYDSLRKDGNWFDKKKSAGYKPIDQHEFSKRLREFKTKTKSSLLMQIADLYLWPMCLGGYDTGNTAYRALIEANKLIDCALSPEDMAEKGIKYSCFKSAQIFTV